MRQGRQVLPESHGVLRMGAFICGKERLAEAVVFLGFLEKEGQNMGVLRGQLHGASVPGIWASISRHAVRISG